MVVIIKYIIKIIAFQLGVCPSPIYQRTGPQHDWRNGDYPLSRTDIQQGSSDYRILLTSNEAPPIHDRPHLLNPGAAGTPSTHGSTRYSKYTSTYFAIYTTSTLYAGMVHEYIYIYISSWMSDHRFPVWALSLPGGVDRAVGSIEAGCGSLDPVSSHLPWTFELRAGVTILHDSRFPFLPFFPSFCPFFLVPSTLGPGDGCLKCSEDWDGPGGTAADVR